MKNLTKIILGEQATIWAGFAITLAGSGFAGFSVICLGLGAALGTLLMEVYGEN